MARPLSSAVPSRYDGKVYHVFTAQGTHGLWETVVYERGLFGLSKFYKGARVRIVFRHGDRPIYAHDPTPGADMIHQSVVRTIVSWPPETWRSLLQDWATTDGVDEVVVRP